MLVTSRANPRLKQLRAAMQGHARLAQGLIAVEGEHLIQEALATRQAIKTIFITEKKILPTFIPTHIELIRLPADLFSQATDTHSPQGIAALLVPPAATLPAIANPLYLVAANLQDPGNLGTLIRSAHAFAATAVLTTAGTVSPWNNKAIRASAGSCFHIPIVAIDTLPATTQILAATPTATTPIHALDLTLPTTILIGNEGAGLPPALLSLATHHVTIPTPGAVESLNAAIAGSLLLYEASRQRTKLADNS